MNIYDHGGISKQNELPFILSIFSRTKTSKVDDERRAEAEQQALLVGASMGEDMKSMSISNGTSLKTKVN